MSRRSQTGTWRLIDLESWLDPAFRKKRMPRHIEVSEDKKFRELVHGTYIDLKTDGDFLVVTEGFHNGVPVKRRLRVQNIWYRHFVEDSEGI